MYAVFISSTTNSLDTMRQFIIANHNGENYCFTRLTNGGRGESNAWTDIDYADVKLNANDYQNYFVVGEVIATPLTPVDTTALDNRERPNVLIQKMSKQFASRGQLITEQRTSDVLNELFNVIETDVSKLSEYRLDGRKDRGNMTATKNTEQVIQVKQEVREPKEFNANALVVPTKEQIGWYLPRTFSGVSEFDIYEHARKNRKPMLFEGHAGTGKTSSAINYAYQMGIGVGIQNCSAGLQLSDVIGKVTILPSGEAGWIDGALTKAMRFGGVYVLDEINFAQPKVLQRFQDVANSYVLELHENNGEVIHAHPDFVLVATYNNGYKHTNALNEAVLDRYKLKLYFDYDYEIESRVVKLPTLLSLAKSMRNDAIQGIYSTPVSLRMLKSFQELATDLNYDFAVNNFLMCFNADERPSVKLLIEAHSTQLQDEVSKLQQKVGA